MAIPLNPAQAAAVEHHAGPILVLAGAGSGKTRVITHRIARLVDRGIPPQAILALTFTNKAAGEMAERVGALLKERAPAKKSRAKGGERGGVVVSTFHSFGLQVLGREKKSLGGTFTIFDQGDQVALVKDLLLRVDRGRAYDAMAVVSRISNAKNGFLTPEDLLAGVRDEYDEVTAEVYPRYQAALRNFRAFDFDDLVCEVARILQEKQDVRERWQNQFRYVLVDEYQDTNGAQLALLRLIVEQHKNLCVVGDDDQSIYAWRGADVRNILEFEEHFPGAMIVKLEQNYRSRAPILAVANAVISKRNDAKHKKTLFTDRAGGEKVKVGASPSPEAEATWVAKSLKKNLRDEGRRAKDLAVLFRSNGQVKLLEEALREEGVPHRVVGGQQFFERKEVKDVLSFLKLALNRHDEIALRRIVNYPPRGIGETSIERLSLHSLAKGWTLWQTIERVDSLDDIPNGAREGCKQLERLVAETRKNLLVDRMKGSEVLRVLSDRAGVKGDLDVSSGSLPAAARRWGNVESLIQSFARREVRERTQGRDETDERSLAAFLHALTLKFDEEEEESGERVTLSTLHGSKGLEFDVVYLVGCEEGLLPHSRTLEVKATDSVATGAAIAQAASDVEEERRLFYVGVTRAREVLYLTRSKARMVRGKPVPRTPSRFLMDIPEELVDVFDIRDENVLTTDEVATQAAAFLAMLEGKG